MGEREGHSSIKVHHAPGGSSNLNIFGGGEPFHQPPTQAPQYTQPPQQQMS